jgi:hypothetical protein
MTLGRTPEQDLLRSTATFCDGKLSPTSIYSLLYRECHNLFPDSAFADLFEEIGRRSIPPRIVAVVMVLQAAGDCRLRSTWRPGAARRPGRRDGKRQVASPLRLT